MRGKQPAMLRAVPVPAAERPEAALQNREMLPTRIREGKPREAAVQGAAPEAGTARKTQVHQAPKARQRRVPGAEPHPMQLPEGVRRMQPAEARRVLRAGLHRMRQRAGAGLHREVRPAHVNRAAEEITSLKKAVQPANTKNI